MIFFTNYDDITIREPFVIDLLLTKSSMSCCYRDCDSVANFQDFMDKSSKMVLIGNTADNWWRY